MPPGLNFGRKALIVEIHLQGHGSGSYASYTTGDRIEGFITVIARRDTPLGKLGIVFHGKSQILADQLLLYARTKCDHLFLKLAQPLDDAPHLLKKDQEYRFTFSFVVPGKLPSQACQHSRQNIHVFEAHTQLPPTLGWVDREHDNAGATDDLASDVAQISYTIRVLLFAPTSTRGSEEPISTTTKPVRIIPKVEEQPPRENFGSRFYCTHKERVFTHGLMGRSLGRLRVSVSQPGPIKATQLGLTQDQNVNTTANVQLSFDAVGTQEPPALCNITTKLCAVTLYSATPWETLPDLLVGDSSFAHGGRGIYWNTVTNSSMSIKSVCWTQNPMSTDDSTTVIGSSDLSVPLMRARYTASIVVPVVVPARYQLVPTFHSCLVSRIYLLDVSLQYCRPGAKSFTSDVRLRVPVQIMT